MTTRPTKALLVVAMLSTISWAAEYEMFVVGKDGNKREVKSDSEPSFFVASKMTTRVGCESLINIKFTSKDSHIEIISGVFAPLPIDLEIREKMAPTPNASPLYTAQNSKEKITNFTIEPSKLGIKKNAWYFVTNSKNETLVCGKIIYDETVNSMSR